MLKFLLFFTHLILFTFLFKKKRVLIFMKKKKKNLSKMSSINITRGEE